MTCDSCGSDTGRLEPVRRKYITAADGDREPSARVIDEVEHWCFACLTHYPHVPA